MNFEAPRNTIEYENQEEHPRISIEEKRQNRLFSQTYYREDRKRLAEDIRILRKTQKERRKDLDIGIAAAVERKSEQEHIAVDLAIDIERLSNDLAQLGNDFLTSLVHFFKKSSLQKTLASKQELLKISESIHLFYKDQETFFRERQLLIKDSSEITNTLRSFHADQLEKCREYEHLREQTSIQHFTETYGAAIIHGTMPFHSPNAALSKSYELDWVDKIDVILSIPLALSASTVHPDRPHFENHIPYGPVGIVLVSGQIVGASEQDAGTTRSSREQMPESPSALQTVLKNISQVMDTKNSSGRYNEFVVRTPGIGALWIEHSPNKQEQKKILATIGGIKRVFEKSRELGVPAYAIWEGKFYTIKSSGDHYELCDAINTSSIARLHPVFMQSKKRQDAVFSRLIRKNVFSDPELAALPPETRNLLEFNRNDIAESFS